MQAQSRGGTGDDSYLLPLDVSRADLGGLTSHLRESLCTRRLCNSKVLWEGLLGYDSIPHRHTVMRRRKFVNTKHISAGNEPETMLFSQYMM